MWTFSHTLNVRKHHESYWIYDENLFLEAAKVVEDSVEFVDDLPMELPDVVVGHLVDPLLHQSRSHVAENVASAS